jgi:hypothetical protein
MLTVSDVRFVDLPVRLDHTQAVADGVGYDRSGETDGGLAL